MKINKTYTKNQDNFGALDTETVSLGDEMLGQYGQFHNRSTAARPSAFSSGSNDDGEQSNREGFVSGPKALEIHSPLAQLAQNNTNM